MISKVISVGGDYVVLKLKSNGRQYNVSFDKLSAADVEYLRNYDPDDAQAGADEDEVEEEEVATSRLYPRTKEEIRATIREIKKTPQPKDLSRKVHDAVKTLNIYRFLCGVSHDVEGDKKMSEHSEEAALACKKNGGLSHDLGSSTDKCNLSSMGDMEGSVPQYIDDAGANNRERRGHRAWCLNPSMGKVGFGSAGDSYSAMWCMDSSGRSKVKDFWSYPGRGLFPLDYLHGNAWSVYIEGKLPPIDEVKVEVFRLKKRPESPLSMKGEIEGESIKVTYIAKSILEGINFEMETPASRGIYWVRVTGGDLRIGYVVELF